MQRKDAVAGLIVLLLVMALDASAAGAAKRGVSRGCTGANVLAAGDDARKAAVAAILCHVNRQRTIRGLAPVRVSQQLSQGAIAHSEDMEQRNFFSHVSSNGMSLRQRVRSSGYPLNSRSLVAETLAWGSSDFAAPTDLVRSLMGSPFHKRIILDRRFRDIGIGLTSGVPVAELPTGATLTLVFGRR